MKKRRAAMSAILFVLLFTLLFGAAQRLLVPHDKEANPEAFLIREYVESEGEQAEVVFLGDCEVYECYSPVTLWQRYGIQSRVCGSPQQLMWHSYAVLDEVFRRSEPRVVVLGVYGLCYGEPQSEAYNRMALEALPMTAAKWSVLRETMTKDESTLSYLLPLLRYHDRWSELTKRDVSLLWQKQPLISSCGFLVQTGVRPADSATPHHEGAVLPVDPSFGELTLAYFDRIVALCRQNGAELILVKSPTDSWRYPWTQEYESQVVALAEAYGLPYYNFLEDFEQIGLDLRTDSYDGGLHLNVWGAEKLSAYFGQILTENFELTDARRDAAAVARWQLETERYEDMKKGGKTP